MKTRYSSGKPSTSELTSGVFLEAEDIASGTMGLPPAAFWLSGTDGADTGGPATGIPILSFQGDVFIPGEMMMMEPEVAPEGPAWGMEIGTTFDITINYTGDARFRAAFQAAEARWEQIITGEIPDVQTTQWGLIDDLQIDATINYIDGPSGVLGRAGPDLLRNGSYLPVHGIMQFDSADMEGMLASGILSDVILHEMGHVLGLGTIWGQSYLRLQNGGQYTGQFALAEYRTLTGNPNATFIPVETDGGSGTAFAHWDDRTFGNELMTGYISGGTNPLSRMSVAAFRDMGYTVNMAAADPYTLPASPPPPSPPPGGTDDYADSITDTTAPFGQIAGGSMVTGSIETANDLDLFRLQVTRGTSYTVTLQALSGSSTPLSDPYLRLRDASGTVIAANDDSGGTLNSQLTWTAPGNGTFYVEASGYSTNTGNYRLAVTASAPIENDPVWRFFNTQAGGHFFTTSIAERDQVITTLPQYNFEGIGYYAQDAGTTGATSVWRFFNTLAGGHFFTTSIAERDQVIATLPQYNFEGTGYYASTAARDGFDPVWRFFNTLAGGHFFTTSIAERDQVITTLPQYNFEGIGYYAPRSESAGLSDFNLG